MSSHRILIVDDDASNTAPLAELLRDEGYDVAVASDGLDALAMLDSFAPDVLLTDLRMPGLGGAALIDRARRAAPGLPVVIMTAYGASASRIARARGPMDFVTKPIDVVQLLTALERALGRGAASVA